MSNIRKLFDLEFQMLFRTGYIIRVRENDEGVTVYHTGEIDKHKLLQYLVSNLPRCYLVTVGTFTKGVLNLNSFVEIEWGLQLQTKLFKETSL